MGGEPGRVRGRERGEKAKSFFLLPGGLFMSSPSRGSQFWRGIIKIKSVKGNLRFFLSLLHLTLEVWDEKLHFSPSLMTTTKTMTMMRPSTLNEATFLSSIPPSPQEGLFFLCLPLSYLCIFQAFTLIRITSAERRGCFLPLGRDSHMFRTFNETSSWGFSQFRRGKRKLSSAMVMIIINGSSTHSWFCSAPHSLPTLLFSASWP